MAKASEPYPLGQGMYYRFINPEGSSEHRVPKVKMWKRQMKRDPLNEHKRVPWYQIIEAPYSSNVNGGKSIELYASKGFHLFERILINGVVYRGAQPDEDMSKVNLAYLERAHKAHKKVNPQLDSITKLAKIVEMLAVKGMQRTDQETELLSALKQDLALRQMELEKDVHKDKQDKKESPKRTGTEKGS